MSAFGEVWFGDGSGAATSSVRVRVHGREEGDFSVPEEVSPFEWRGFRLGDKKKVKVVFVKDVENGVSLGGEGALDVERPYS